MATLKSFKNSSLLALPAITMTGHPQHSQVSMLIQILLIFTVISIAPSILIMMTSFVRIVVVLSFLRTSLGLSTEPPNQVIIGLSLFLTFFIMAPVINSVYKNAYIPYTKGSIGIKKAYKTGMRPVRGFMLKQTRLKDLELFVKMSKLKNIRSPKDVPTYVLIPAFIVSELTTAFEISFLIYLPFLILDLVVSSLLMSMGMLMLPPTMISLPFKLMLFVMVNGWYLVIGSLVQSFK
ncbi:MAG: flagellar type III secretion system pore protein FliP [Deltaproteobacteria bacterium]|nr:flagellar type III secretion system pore protein FliP [Deltaproteobacteria bacterium]MDA8157577.1 flagellar type III secretion system pore protein FliP [Deltaproteobacteria bacterium]